MYFEEEEKAIVSDPFQIKWKHFTRVQFTLFFANLFSVER